MSTEANKDLVRRYLDVTMNEHNVWALDDFTSPDYVGHMSGAPTMDQAAHKQLFGVFLRAFPDMRVTIDDLIAEGDRVGNRTTYTGTHTGDFQGIPATGKRFSIGGINVSRIANGKVVEDWTVIDQLGMLQQLGVALMPTAPTS